jgi:hypothetical protein
MERPLLSRKLLFAVAYSSNLSRIKVSCQRDTQETRCRYSNLSDIAPIQSAAPKHHPHRKVEPAGLIVCPKNYGGGLPTFHKRNMA